MRRRGLIRKRRFRPLKRPGRTTSRVESLD
nr:MAG TPA: hypothetical protein [Bacteriophage sp.]